MGSWEFPMVPEFPEDSQGIPWESLGFPGDFLRIPLGLPMGSWEFPMIPGGSLGIPWGLQNS